MKKCTSLEEVRNEIDKIDDQILELIAKRKDMVKQAANFKHSVEEIKTDERIDHVIDKVRHRALMLGVSPNMVTDIYRQMIEEMVETEIAQFRNAKNF
ncbi:MAG: chorismate mutase [Sulfurospirillum sp.]|nr:MAG: chorismate mutase [Sulfurospirillum sp.]